MSKRHSIFRFCFVFFLPPASSFSFRLRFWIYAFPQSTPLSHLFGPPRCGQGPIGSVLNVSWALNPFSFCCSGVHWRYLDRKPENLFGVLGRAIWYEHDDLLIRSSNAERDSCKRGLFLTAVYIHVSSPSFPRLSAPCALTAPCETKFKKINSHSLGRKSFFLFCFFLPPASSFSFRRRLRFWIYAFPQSTPLSHLFGPPRCGQGPLGSVLNVSWALNPFS